MPSIPEASPHEHVQPNPQPVDAAQLDLQGQVHFHLGPVSVNVYAWDIMTPEHMETMVAQAQEALAANGNAQVHVNMFFGEQNERRDHVDVDQQMDIVPNQMEEQHPEFRPAEQRHVQIASDNAHNIRRVLLKQSKFVTLPLEIHLKICEWLSVRDIISLRRISRHMCKVSHNGTLWLSAMKRLNLVLPSFPSTSKHLYGEIKPFMAEYLVTRSVRLHENFVFHPLTGSLTHQDTYDNILEVRILPGAKFIVVLSQNFHGEVYVALWEMKLYKSGARIPLAKTRLTERPELFEAVYGTHSDQLHIFIASVTPPVQNETTLQFITKISIMAIPLELLEELADRHHSKDTFSAVRGECPHPFVRVYETSVAEKIQQIAMCDVQHTTLSNTLMISMVCRPRLLMFDYPELRSKGYTGSASFISLGSLDIVNPVLPTSIWKIKMLPWQNAVLVSQIITGMDGSDLQTIGIFLYPLPALGKVLKSPPSIGSQYLRGISATGVYFSNLEEGWFSAVRNPDKLLDSQFHSAPAPISIYVSTKGSSGLIQAMLHPTALLDEIIPVRGGKGHVTKFRYDFPFQIVKRSKWQWDDLTFCDILPGAFFSFAYLRSASSCVLDKLGLGVPKPISRFIGYQHIPHQYRLASITTTGAYIRHNTGYSLEESNCYHSWTCPERCPFHPIPGVNVGDIFRRKPLSPLPWSNVHADASFTADMKKGVVAIAFDESSGVVCYSVDSDTRLRFLDFGGRFAE